MTTLTIMNPEAVVDTANENLQNQIDNMSYPRKRVKSFKEYAFMQAGLNGGSHIALLANLKYIKDGHLVDETYNENDEQILKKQAEEKIGAKNEEKQRSEGDLRSASEVSKPSIENEIKDLNAEIQQIKIDLEENKIQTGYHPEKYFLYMGLTVLLGVYLLLFYASAIYASWFRNPIEIIQRGGTDIALSLESIFDPKGIFTPSAGLVIVYLGAFLFFALGIIPHTFEGKNKKLLIGLALFGAFIADGVLAFRIDLGMHNLKVMAGLGDANWTFYSSINFYMVLLFGFCAYLVWGYMFEMMLTEKNKKTGDVKAALLIKGLKDQIQILKRNLQVLESRIIELETQIATINAQLEQLKKELESRMLNPNLLSQNLTSFYLGWHQFLNNTDLVEERLKCEEVYNDYMQKNFNQASVLN